MAEQKAKASPVETANLKITESVKNGEAYYVTAREAAHIKTVAANAAPEGKPRNATHAKIWAACNRAHLKSGENVLDPTIVAPATKSSKQGQKAIAADPEVKAEGAATKIKQPKQKKAAEPEEPAPAAAQAASPGENAVVKIAEAIQRGAPYYVASKEASYITRVTTDLTDEGKVRGIMRDMLWAACRLAYLESGANVCNPTETIAPAARSSERRQKTSAADLKAETAAETPKVKQPRQRKIVEPTIESEISTGVAAVAGVPSAAGWTKSPTVRLRKVAIIHALDALCNDRATSALIVDADTMAKVRAAAKKGKHSVEEYMKVKVALRKLPQEGDLIEIDLAAYAQLLESCPALSIFERVLVDG
jgi:hypothetical protein